MITSHSYFFGPQHEIFGWLTLPASGRRDVAVLLCPPVGHEQVCAYGAYRELATELGTAGFASLRFDYAGTGNSLGDDQTPRLVTRWLDSIHAAASELRRATGCASVVIVGLRLGGTLGLLAASRREDVTGLVLWAACPDGRSFVRETRVLGLVETDDSPTEDVDAAGFRLSAETAAALAELAIRDAVPRSVTHALVVGRRGARVDERTVMELRESLRSCGADCDEQWFSEYADFMVSPIQSRTPHAAIRGIVQWFRDHFRAASVADPVQLPSGAVVHRDQTGAFREESVCFGEGLFGIVTAPGAARNTRRAAILLNTGGDHHIGPHRLFVPLARALAQRGVAVLRFDLRGIGESGVARPDPVEAYPLTAAADVAAAISLMRERFPDSPLSLAGMCSGGFHALHASRLGVDGIVAVNPPLYWMPGRPLDADERLDRRAERRLVRSILTPANWLRVVTGRTDVRTNLRIARQVLEKRLRDSREQRPVLPESGVPRPDVAALLPFDRAISLVFSADDPAHEFFREAVGGYIHVLESRDNFRIRVVEGADHTFMPRVWRAAVSSILLEELSGAADRVPSPIPAIARVAGAVR